MFLLGLSFTHVRAEVLPSALHGTWHCGPSVGMAKKYSVTLTGVTTYHPDGTFTSYAKSRFAPYRGQPINMESTVSGSWILAASVIETKVESAQFLSSDNPYWTVADGQANMDAVLAKGETERSRIMKFSRSGMEVHGIDVREGHPKVQVCRQAEQ